MKTNIIFSQQVVLWNAYCLCWNVRLLQIKELWGKTDLNLGVEVHTAVDKSSITFWTGVILMANLMCILLHITTPMCNH